MKGIIGVIRCFSIVFIFAKHGGCIGRAKEFTDAWLGSLF